MDLNEIAVFARVVQTGSFTTAAAALGMPISTVSRKVADLEERLGARLLQRTTRRLSLTDAGRTYYDYCARIVAEVEDAERAVSSLQEAPRGLSPRSTAPRNSAPASSRVCCATGTSPPRRSTPCTRRPGTSPQRSRRSSITCSSA